MRTTGLVLGLLMTLGSVGLAQIRVSLDSVVLERTETLCIGECRPIADVILRRRDVPAWMLDTIEKRAQIAGFYEMPADLRDVPWCQVNLTDQLMATLTIYRPDGRATIQGYHHCSGRLADTTNVTPPEKQRLLNLEALIDSVAGRRGRFH